jgi:uncharacterized iron-regulated membrane protein
MGGYVADSGAVVGIALLDLAVLVVVVVGATLWFLIDENGEVARQPPPQQKQHAKRAYRWLRLHARPMLLGLGAIVLLVVRVAWSPQ